MLIVGTTTARNLLTILVVFGLAVALAAVSRVSLRTLVTRAWLGALIFTGTIAFPVIFITPGDALVRVPILDWTITAQGLKSAAYLITRVETTVTLSLLLILCTLWSHVLKALRVLRVPIVLVVILGMTYRYLFVMLETAQHMFEARQSRVVCALSGAESRRVAASSVGVLLTKSVYLNNEIFLAMQSRGFRGEIYTLDEFAMRSSDWLALAAFLLTTGIVLWLGQADWLF